MICESVQLGGLLADGVNCPKNPPSGAAYLGDAASEGYLPLPLHLFTFLVPIFLSASPNSRVGKECAACFVTVEKILTQLPLPL